MLTRGYVLIYWLCIALPNANGDLALTLKSLLGACALATTLAAPAAAAPVNVDFSFAGVTGTFFGLDDAITTLQPATTVSIFGIADDYLIADFSAVSGGFFFSDGDLSFPDVSIGPSRQIIEGEAGTGSFGSLSCSQREGCTLVEFDNFEEDFITTGPAAAMFTVTPAAVPVPAGAVLMLTGLAGLAGLSFRGRKKRTA